MTTWQPMSVGGRGQWTGDIWRLHAYAHPAQTNYGVRSPACWSLYLHTEKVAGGTARWLRSQPAIEGVGGVREGRGPWTRGRT